MLPPTFWGALAFLVKPVSLHNMGAILLWVPVWFILLRRRLDWVSLLLPLQSSSDAPSPLRVTFWQRFLPLLLAAMLGRLLHPMGGIRMHLLWWGRLLHLVGGIHMRLHLWCLCLLLLWHLISPCLLCLRIPPSQWGRPLQGLFWWHLRWPLCPLPLLCFWLFLPPWRLCSKLLNPSSLLRSRTQRPISIFRTSSNNIYASQVFYQYQAVGQHSRQSGVATVKM